jgi:PKD repeat protein
VQGFEWDFDGDQEPDAYTPADRPGSKRTSAAIQHAYNSPASLFPAVRAVDTGLFVSPWDSFDSGGQPVQLVIGDSAPPQVVMGQWSPYSAAGPDGGPETRFSFSAEASSASGIARIEWDFDGDGEVDRTARVSGSSSARATAEHTYGVAGSWVPRVRAVDAGGLPSMWAGYYYNNNAAGGGKAAALDTAVPRLTVALEFSPAAATELPATFTFKVVANNEPDAFEWDFDGDGVVDSTTSAPTARHTFVKSGIYLPSVTVSDASGLKATAVPTANGEPLYIRLLPAAPSAQMEQWSPYVATGADGEQGTRFTFSASSSAKGGVQKIEWDFDGDGRVDSQTMVAENPLSARATATHSYGAPGSYMPRARAVDAFGQTSAWATYTAGERPAMLDIAASSKLLPGETYCGGMTIEQLIAAGQYRVFDGRAVPQKKSITGTAGKDLMIAGTGSTVMRGLGGNDCIIGGPGNDTILGGAGDDLIFGAAGDDRINGNAGINRIDGGAGRDRCAGAFVNCER